MAAFCDYCYRGDVPLRAIQVEQMERHFIQIVTRIVCAKCELRYLGIRTPEV